MTAKNVQPHLRQRIAYEAARLIMEERSGNHGLALRKAAGRLGAHNKRLWPSNAEVEEALQLEQRLFRKQQPVYLQRLRETAVEAMRAFSRFEPHLIGPVADGTADGGVEVTLYLFAEAPEEVVFALLEQRIPWKDRERTLRYADGSRITHPVFSFVAGDIPIELIVLPQKDRKAPPLSPLTDRPERGSSISRVEEMLSTMTSDDHL